VTAADLRRLYRQLRYIRHVEEEIARIYPSDKIKSPVHLSIGQEFVAVAVCDPLRPVDVVSATYRGHAAYLAKGGDLNAMIAELYGKQTGSAGGKGGSMHLIDMTSNVIGCSAVVGTTAPIAAGYALAFKRQKQDRLVVSFMGDGATEEGSFAETLNFAALQKLPILFVCENNGYAIHEPLAKRWATTELCERVATWGIPARKIDSGDIFAIRAAAIEAVERIRGGGGPQFLECVTYRWRGHVGPELDYDAGYRADTDLTPWLENDQVDRLGKMIEPRERDEIDRDVVRIVAEAVAFAETSPAPDKSELFANVYAR
jgi:TPP-dependent pyruvate/acetoin dehydrogenase alpha subunit